ncbi:MAG: divalent-cation tolerance protein CutA [Gemmatimonadales bacterium]
MSETRPDALVVLVSGPDTAVLGELAVRVVEEGLAACVNLIPAVSSVYRWEGQVRRDDEALALIKTTRPALDALRTRIHELHPYEVPEFLALPVEAGGAAYLGWIGDCVAVGPRTRETDEQA